MTGTAVRLLTVLLMCIAVVGAASDSLCQPAKVSIPRATADVQHVSNTPACVLPCRVTAPQGVTVYMRATPPAVAALNPL
jgi:hypothetical protein